MNIGIGPGYAIYNVSSNALIRGNVLEANIWSFGTNYGSLMRNNIINGHDAQVERVSVFVVDPKVSFRIYDNKLTEMFMEFDHNNSKTYVTCNEWYDETYAFVGGLLTQYPLSWGTASRAAGNRWDVTKSEMYNLSSLDSDLDYYYRAVSNETFNYYDGIDDHVSSFENATCTYTWPTLYTELDPSEYVVDIEDLEDEYDSLQSEIESIIGHMDTTVLSVKEELAYLRSLLSDLVCQGLLFHTSLDSGFWTNEVDLKVVELLGLNHLWYGMDMYSITEHLDSNPDPDAEALYDAAEKMSEYFDGGKNLINLTTLQVDTLQTIAESSFGDYTNILRNYLFVMYDVFVPWLIENPMDSLMRKTPIVQTPIGSPIETITYHTLSPNPFTDYIRIQRKNIIQEQGDNHIYVYNLEGVLLHSTLFDENSGAINLSDLEPGFYILTIENTTSGSIETKRIYKVRK